MEVHLKPAGERYLERLAALHEAELRSLQDTFRVAQITAFNDEDREAVKKQTRLDPFHELRIHQPSKCMKHHKETWHGHA